MTGGPGRRVLVTALAIGAAACAIRPRPTAESLERARNARAVVEGRVVDSRGVPVPGVSVQGLPREKDLLWSPASVTDADGFFRLEVFAPGEYSFLVSWNGISVITPRRDDPARVALRLEPGERRTKVELVFRRDDWGRAPLSPRGP